MRSKQGVKWLGLVLMAAATALGQSDDRLVGIWDNDEGFRTSQLLFRSNGRYQLDTKSTDPIIDLASTERGQYQVEGQTLVLTPYDYLVHPDPRQYHLERSGDALSLTSADFGQVQSFHFRPGSDLEVRGREQVKPLLVRVWRRHVKFFGDIECTFRPGGHYVIKRIPDNTQFAPDYIRGLYEQAQNQITFKPYSAAQEVDEADFFGDELTLIYTDNFSRESVTFQSVPGTDLDVPAKAAAAEAFLARTNWQVGVWEVRDGRQKVDLTLRPDGRYCAERDTGSAKEIVRGRYTLEGLRIRLTPFVGQSLYSHSGAEFGNAEQIRQLDYYDGQLQFIDLESIIQSVTVAQLHPGSETSVSDKVRQAQAEQARADWCVGLWEVNDAAGWMEFTFRPDGRYIAKAGREGVPKEVERGRFRMVGGKLTLACYPNLGQPGGFETDFYDGTLLLISDPQRMLVARKAAGSEVGVRDATIRPHALDEARGALVGLWTLSLNGYHAELILRPDGQFRLARCLKGILSQEYGLFSVDLPARTLVLDSRLTERITTELDFYANTMTLVSTNQGFPATYFVRPDLTDAALQLSMAADLQEVKLNEIWLERVPIGPINPDVGQVPSLPYDFQPEHVFKGATVFTQYRHYQRVIRGFVYGVPVDNLQEWHFLRNGRVMIRFIQHRGAFDSPVIIAEVIDVWGAYRIEPNQAGPDILHFYANNSLRIDTDAGEELELSLENGRRYLFWGRDRAVLDEWAAQDQVIPCQPPVDFDPSQMNTGISLQTTVPPDILAEPSRFSLSRSGAGNLTVQGTSSGSATLVTEFAESLTSPIVWKILQTNAVSGGAFEFAIPRSNKIQTYYRLRQR